MTIMTRVMTRIMTAGGVAACAGALPAGLGAAYPSAAAPPPLGAELVAQAGKALHESTAGAGGAGMVMILGVTLLSIAPALVASLTTFTRFTIVLAFLRQGIGMPGVPPNQVLAALALFLTLFSMEPTIDAVWKRAVSPCLEGKMAVREAAEAGLPVAREFMLRQTRPADLMLLAELSGQRRPATPDDVRLPTLAAAFLLSELKTAFQIGLVILLPFLLVDLLVCVAISALGLSGLPANAVALPVKLALFVSVDGWNLIVGSLVRSIR
jgi:flagellar biosynthetic protein FliP